MALETKIKVIGNTKYHIPHLGHAAWRSTLVKVANMAGPVLGDIIRGLALDSSKQPTQDASVKRFFSQVGEMDISSLGTAIGGMFARLDDDELGALTAVFAERSLFEPSGAKGPRRLTLEEIEVHFCGTTASEYLPWLWACLEHNYKGLFSALSGLGGGGPNPSSPDSE